MNELLLCILIFVTVVTIVLIYYMYSKKNLEKYSTNSFNKKSFFYYDKIEDDTNKSILAIDETQKHAFYIVNFSPNVTIKELVFPMAQLPFVVYYKTEEAKALFLIVCKIYDMDTSQVIFEKQDEKFASVKDAQLFVTLIPIDEFESIRTLRNMKVYNYTNIDQKKLSVLLPYAQFLHQDIKPSNSVYKFINFDTCIYQNNKKYTSNDLKTNKLVQNFYNMLGYKIIQKKQVTFSDDVIVQKYVKDRVTFTMEENVNGKITRMVREEFIEFMVVDDLEKMLNASVQIGDVIILKKQKHVIENNKYIFVGDNKLVTAIPLVYDNAINDDNNEFILYKSNEAYFVQLYDKVYFTNIDKGAIILKKYNKENIIYLECKKITDVEKFDQYECVTNQTIKFKGQCESDYTLDGTRKKSFDVWDRRCKYNSECPFFSLDNYKGGCNDNGFCEMPLGVKNIGYRTFLTGNDSPECPYKDKSGKCIF